MIGRRELMGSVAATTLGGAMARAQGTATRQAGGFRIAQGSRWVAIGDSITDTGRARPVGESPGGLGTGYVQTIDALLGAWYPARRIRLFNVGTSGHTVRDLAERWQTDVIDLKPNWLSVMIGANDVWRQFDRVTQPERSVLPPEYEQTYDALLTKTTPLLNGGLILVTPFFLEARTNDPMRARMDEYGAIVKKLAAKHKAVLVDSQAAFDVVLKDLPSAMINWDRVHLNHIGAAVLSRAILSSVGFEWA
ncbi:MAG TPA: SGNH/GDSL hydrolase family protein [Luteitalea sp.]|nr:SGNH/GDSL hydrolase family protein [Luteitalea sp.]